MGHNDFIAWVAERNESDAGTRRAVWTGQTSGPDRLAGHTDRTSGVKRMGGRANTADWRANGQDALAVQ